MAGDNANSDRYDGCREPARKDYGLVDDQVRLLRVLLAGAQVIIAGVWIAGALHDRHRPPAERRFTRWPRGMLIAGIGLALAGVLTMVLVTRQD
jgi:hypothetical protein